jgi:hypothetical protein
VAAGHRGHFDERARRVLPQLRIDRPESGMTVELDLVRGQRDQSASTHRVMRDHCDNAAIVVAQCPGDLARRQHESAGSVEDDLDRHSRRCLANRSEQAFGIVDVDVPRQGNAKQGDRLLAVDQGNNRGIASHSDEGQDAALAERHHRSLDDWLERADDDEQPEPVENAHLPHGQP